MNWKLIIIGGIVFWLVTNILGMFVTGILIHEKILDPVYQANESFWLPELRQDPPDMAALMPQWLLTSFVSSLVVVGDPRSGASLYVARGTLIIRASGPAPVRVQAGHVAMRISGAAEVEVLPPTCSRP